MSMAEVLSHVRRINGVGGYILLDKSGNIITHSAEMKAPQKLSKMVYSCGKSLSSIGNKYFKYGSFSRKQNRDILIFPVGNYKYYLGVVKQADSRTFETAVAVMAFLNVLVGKRD